jgi:Tfp pilus assembly protein PilE
MIKRITNKLGYTLGEIVITTAIIGSLAAIAVPNFLRIKMNVNMELVKQQMRILGQNLNELYNQNSPHQYPEDILTLDGNPAEELAITASLNAINRMGYEIEHFVPEDRSTFLDIARLQPGMEGISGDTCYALDPMGLRVLENCWGMEGLDTFIGGVSPISEKFLGMLFSNPNLSESDKVKILSGMFIQYGFFLDSLAGWFDDLAQGFDGTPLKDPQGASTANLPTLFAPMKAEDKSVFDQLIEKVNDHLKENGVQIRVSYEENVVTSFGGPTTSGLRIAVEFDEKPQAVQIVSRFARQIVYTEVANTGYLTPVIPLSNKTINADSNAYIEAVSNERSSFFHPHSIDTELSGVGSLWAGAL